MQTIASTIAFFRNAKRWTQDHLAREVAIPQSTLSEIENGQISPKWDLILLIADRLDVPIISLIPQGGGFVYNHNNQDNVNANGVVHNYNQANDAMMNELLKMVLETQNKLLAFLQQHKNDG